MALTVQLLKQLIASLPPSESSKAALNFLKQSDLTQIVPARGPSGYMPAEYWLRVYKIKHGTATEAGIATYGFPLLLAALQKLPPSAPVAITAFETREWHGAFWSEQADQLVGFGLVKRRSTREEQDRLDWFRRNLT
ncbi:hypothetical protein [Bradyrhizobium sp. McL0616]|uniref:hypothetical protein n=1 Tax=Bradyrhizobium sp. McL0616 TaxID=3415674 RepID=UPI003CE8C380